jgi:hypothetical protein
VPSFHCSQGGEAIEVGEAYMANITLDCLFISQAASLLFLNSLFESLSRFKILANEVLEFGWVEQ